MSVKKLALNGVRSSTPSANNSKRPARQQRLTELLRRVFNKYQKLDDPELHRKARLDFVFHMTDWHTDLRGLAELYDHPERFDADRAGRVVAGFLIHALGHVRAASELMLDTEGVFFSKPGEVPPGRSK
jgi:hypothetical protein